MFTLPNLPFAYSALEPHIDALTMEIHHSKHHQAYINKVNAAIDGTALAEKSIEELIVQNSDTPAVRNNGGGHFNHSLFWTILSPNGGGSPTGELSDAINASFGSLSEFKTAFSNAVKAMSEVLIDSPVLSVICSHKANSSRMSCPDRFLSSSEQRPVSSRAPLAKPGATLSSHFETLNRIGTPLKWHTSTICSITSCVG